MTSPLRLSGDDDVIGDVQQPDFRRRCSVGASGSKETQGSSSLVFATLFLHDVIAIYEIRAASAESRFQTKL